MRCNALVREYEGAMHANNCTAPYVLAADVSRWHSLTLHGSVKVPGILEEDPEQADSDDDRNPEDSSDTDEDAGPFNFVGLLLHGNGRGHLSASHIVLDEEVLHALVEARLDVLLASADMEDEDDGNPSGYLDYGFAMLNNMMRGDCLPMDGPW
jgi:hypothetical protein